MDFSQVKSLTIPEGEVTKITDSSGNVLWQKITKGWHTVFEGNFSKTLKESSKRPVFSICTLTACDAPVKLRITGSINTDMYNPKLKFNWLGEAEQDLSLNNHLPFDLSKEITAEDKGIPTSSAIVILHANCYRWTFERINIEFNLMVNPNNNALQFNVISNNLDSHGDDYSFTLNITKVEQYY